MYYVMGYKNLQYIFLQSINSSNYNKLFLLYQFTEHIVHACIMYVSTKATRIHINNNQQQPLYFGDIN
jgi:hypothetical protein